MQRFSISYSSTPTSPYPQHDSRQYRGSSPISQSPYHRCSDQLPGYIRKTTIANKKCPTPVQRVSDQNLLEKHVPVLSPRIYIGFSPKYVRQTTPCRPPSSPPSSPLSSPSVDSPTPVPSSSSSLSSSAVSRTLPPVTVQRSQNVLSSLHHQTAHSAHKQAIPTAAVSFPSTAKQQQQQSQSEQQHLGVAQQPLPEEQPLDPLLQEMYVRKTMRALALIYGDHWTTFQSVIQPILSIF